ncbi:MAG: Hsp20/alpha crystallin family protein [Bifidobacteriaceae bacterium]|jgi:HSP20 family protein|nr:Hsp20/alpha crystallin family protein [Bifidobacteriaceae bacterium]
MAAHPYDPFREIDRLVGQLSRAAAPETRTMPMDLYRQGDVYVVKVDLPGVSPDSIDIDVDDRTLTIRAERRPVEFDASQEGNSWLSRERVAGTYARQISLGPGLDLSRIDANYRDGVLTLTIPVAEEAKPRKITVRTEQVIES